MIYFDNAATSFPKPASVYAEVLESMRTYGGNPGRGSHRLSIAAAEKIYECRERIASLLGSTHPERVCFTVNATAALNLAIKGLLKEGDHVLISDMEHNAVLRPIEKLARAGQITYDVFPTFSGEPSVGAARICRAIARKKRSNTKMLICSHHSNICSCHLPLTEIGRFCRQCGILFVVDAAQSAGHLSIDMEGMCIDALCAPGHKGLWGPQGCGFVLWGENAPVADTLLEGGSGYRSLDLQMPPDAPERFEAGTLPTPAIAGLSAGIAELMQTGIDVIAAHEKQLFLHLLEMLSEFDRVSVYAPHAHGSVLLFNVADLSAEAIGDALDRRGICVRCGYHCAPMAHKSLQTPNGGAVRVGFGFFNTLAETEKLYFALRDILR